MQNRITQMLGVQYPIVQAPMGWIARAPLASACQPKLVRPAEERRLVPGVGVEPTSL